MIELRSIRKRYQIGSSVLWALNGISLKVNKGEFIALKGPSGSGKTTLLNIIGMLDTPTEGEYIIDGNNVAQQDPKSRSILRAKYLGFVFQTFNLIPELNVFENVEIPLLISGENPKKRKNAVMNIIEEVGLSNHINHRPGELSGGQMQRVAIARALVKNPPLIIADEPTANLDSKTGNEIVSLMKGLNQAHQITFIFATHDETITNFMDKIVVISDGVVI
jgi:putative ABC transport system ATP-binding protein